MSGRLALFGWIEHAQTDHQDGPYAEQDQGSFCMTLVMRMQAKPRC